MDTELTGKVFGKYQLKKAIGAGGMGTVYEGLHEALEQKVAVKVLSSQFAANEEAITRFMREGRFVAKLRHDNIVTVYDLGQEDGHHYLSMEYVEGMPLTSLIEKKGAVQPVRALDIARQVADALAAAHEQSVVHRDIKPDNIMINQEGKVKVMDFGIAKAMDNMTELTMEGMTIGTLRYMSPEQCRGTQIDQRTDIFSLGVVLFELLIGRLPYSESLPHLDLMNKIVNGPFPSPRPINPEISETVENIVLKMAMIDLDDRYETAQEVSDEIRQCIRAKAYHSDAKRAGAGGLGGKALKRLFTGGTPKKEKDGKRSTIMRRRVDRELVDEVQNLKGAVRRAKDGKRQQRHAIRRQCKALLYPGAKSLDDMSAGTSPLSVRLLDLSDGGAAVFMKVEQDSGAKYGLELHMDEGKVIRSPAEVSWTRYIEKHDGYATGFQFVDMPYDEEQNLSSILAYIQQTLGL